MTILQYFWAGKNTLWLPVSY